MLFAHLMGVEVGLRPSDVELLLERFTHRHVLHPDLPGADLLESYDLRLWQDIRANILTLSDEQCKGTVSAGCYLGRRPLSSAAPYMGKNREMPVLCFAENPRVISPCAPEQ